MPCRGQLWVGRGRGQGVPGSRGARGAAATRRSRVTCPLLREGRVSWRWALGRQGPGSGLWASVAVQGTHMAAHSRSIKPLVQVQVRVGSLATCSLPSMYVSRARPSSFFSPLSGAHAGGPAHQTSCNARLLSSRMPGGPPSSQQACPAAAGYRTGLTCVPGDCSWSDSSRSHRMLLSFINPLYSVAVICVSGQHVG